MERKILVVYYSRTGVTKKVGQAIAGALGCEQEEIIDRRDRMGPAGYMGAGRDAMFKRLTEIAPIKKDPSQYNLVIIGTPVWAFTMSAAIRTYLARNRDKFNSVAFFCTEGGSGGRRTFREMEVICGKQPVAVLELTQNEVLRNKFSDKLNTFTASLK